MISVKNRFSVFAKCVNPQLGSPQLNSQRFQYLSDSHHILLLTALYELLYILYNVIPWKIIQVSFTHHLCHPTHICLGTPISQRYHFPSLRLPTLQYIPIRCLLDRSPPLGYTYRYRTRNHR